MTTSRAVLSHMDCPGADVTEFTGRRGDRMLYCRACKRYGLAVAPPPPPARTPHKTPTSGFVCGVHLDEQVDARGRGCPQCQKGRQ